LNVGLFDENFACFGTECFDLGFFDDFTASKLLDLAIQITHGFVAQKLQKNSSNSQFVLKPKKSVLRFMK
jgi:hypothetical protein